MKKVNKERKNIKHQIAVLEERMKDKSGLKDQNITIKLSEMYQKLARIDNQLENT